MPDSSRLIRTTKEYQKGIASDPALTRTYQILGGAAPSIPVALLGQQPGAALRASLDSRDQGILELTSG
ncbi:MAG: hypothetical protein JXQ73_13690 [Phycisphaerae bacterium]|nr:hypothetical protein [Phycisphaerae bacterium]